MKNRLFLVGILTACLYVSCIGNKVSFTPQQKTNVLAEVQLMAETIAKNVSAEGPTAWLNGFENTPDFFMASDGQLAFPNYDSATDFINNNLTKSISKIELQWSNMRIDPISDEFATFSAIFHEDITDSTGQKLSQNGYFTATAHKTVQGWKLRNAHWSSIPAHQ